MSSVCQYMTSAFGRTLWQFAALFAVPCVLAVALQWVGAKIRRNGVGWLGNAYWYLVAPGVACHETGHAAGCLLTGCRIVKFVPFTRSDDKRLGYVLHEKRAGLWGDIASVIISSGPIWFGCIMIAILTCLFGGVAHIARYSEYFANDTVPGIVEYAIGMASAASGLSVSLVADGTWGWGFAVWLYLVFCIASEIGLSAVDLRQMWRGISVSVTALLLLNLIPPAGRCVSAGIFVAMPWLFKCHVLMLSSLVLNLALLMAMLFARHFWRRV